MRLALPALAAALALLSACGGGGGSSGFAVSSHTLAFSAEQGLGPSPGTIDLTVTNPKAYQVGAAYTGGQVQPDWLWLAITPIDGTHFQLQATVVKTSMAVGSYSTSFLVGIVDADGNVLASEPVTVTLQVLVRPPYLDGFTPGAFAFTEADGQPLAPGLFMLGLAGTNPRTCAATVALQDDGGWLEVSPAAVTLGATPTTFTVTARPGQPAGIHTGQVTLHCLVDGVDLTQTIPATLTVDDHRLVPSAVGVPLVKSPTRSTLTRQLRISDSLGRAATPWSAAADQAWLSVTPAGTAPGTLTLTADPAGLGAGTHLAWITLSSSDASVGPVERIRVGLTVLDADPGRAFQAGYFGAMAVSPVEPVVFVVRSTGTDIAGFDLNTGAEVRSFPQVAASASRLTLSGDGTRLYAWDGGIQRVLELDALSGAVLRTMGTGAPYTDHTSGMAWVRPAGRPELLLPSTQVYDLETGFQIGDPFLQSAQGGSLVATADGAGVVTGSSTLYALHRTTIPTTRIQAVHAGGPDFLPSSNNACPGADGAHLYRIGMGGLDEWDLAAGAFGAVYPVPATEAVTLRKPVCTGSGLLVTGGQSYPDGHDLWVFAPPSRTPVAALFSTGAISAEYGGLNDLAVSADSTRLVAFSTPQAGPAAGLYFLPLPSAP